MDLILKKPTEIIAYLNYAHANGRLETVVQQLIGQIEVPEQDVEVFILYKNTGELPQSSAHYVSNSKHNVFADIIESTTELNQETEKTPSVEKPAESHEPTPRNQDIEAYPKSNHIWANKELITLKTQIAEGNNPEAIAKILGRSPKSLCSKALQKFNISYKQDKQKWVYRTKK